MRGLPYRASEREIADWLSEAADPDEVIIIMDRWVRVIKVKVIIVLVIKVIMNRWFRVVIAGSS